MIVRIPGPDDLSSKLNEISTLLTATEWHRAAIVAAFVERRGRGERDSSTRRMSPSEFAALGIVGLRDTTTIHLYLSRWLDAHDGIHPEPGAEVVLPDLPWEPRSPHVAVEDPESALTRLISRHGSHQLAEAISRHEELRPRDPWATARLGPVDARPVVLSRSAKMQNDVRMLHWHLARLADDAAAADLDAQELWWLARARAICEAFLDGDSMPLPDSK